MPARQQECERAEEGPPLSPAKPERLENHRENPATDTLGPKGSSSPEDKIVDAITALQRRLRGMEQALDSADEKIFRLRDQVVLWRALCGNAPPKGIASLRRRVAFCCHIGGDNGTILARFNALFDFLEQLDQSSGRPALDRGGN